MRSPTHIECLPGVIFPAEDDRVLPGPQRAPSAAVTVSFVLMAVLMLIGAALLA